MKSWTDFFIKNPISSISLSLCLLVFGVVAFANLDIRLFPKIEASIIQISVDYPGATALTMKNFVTGKILDSLNNLESVDYITSSSQAGNATIEIHFKMGTKVENSNIKILEDIQGIRANLPAEIHEPMVTTVDSNENPDWLLAFTSKDLSPENLSDYLTRYIKPQFEAISGVSSIQVLGPSPAINIKLNSDKMAGFHISTDDVLTALEMQNRTDSSGVIEGEETQEMVNLKTGMTSVSQLRQIVLNNKHQNGVHLSDVATIGWGPETEKIHTFYQGHRAVLLSTKISTKENMLKTLGKMESFLHRIKKEIPSTISVHELVNGRTYLISVMLEMLKTILISLIIVCALTFIFFSNSRSAFLIVLSIPISLLGTGILLWFFGASINILTLLAMILVMGLLVDDAIVVLENIIRHIEMGRSILDSALFGTREIVFPVIAMTLTLGALFFPIGFLGGITGELFLEFSITLVGSILISGLISLSLIPMLSTKLLDSKSNKKPNKYLYHLKANYLYLLKRLFCHKKVVMAVWILSSFGAIYTYAETPKEFAPKIDAGLLEVIAAAPNSSNTHFLLNNAEKLEEIYRKMPEIRGYSIIVGIPSEHQLLSFIRSSTKWRGALQSLINKDPNLNAVTLVPSLMPGTQGMPLEFVLESKGNYRELNTLADIIIEKGERSGLFMFLDKDLHYDVPMLELNIDREAANVMGVSLNSLESSIQNLFGENTVQYVSVNDELYPVIVQASPSIKKDPNFIDNMYVKNDNEKLISLSSLANEKKLVYPGLFNQFQKFNSVTISAVMFPRHSLSEGIQFFRSKATPLLPKSISYDFSGNSREFIFEGNRILYLFLASFFVIFMVLSLQFQSFMDPLIILLGSVPMAVLGAIIPMKLGLTNINIYTQIGFLVLSGMVSKHGILITQFANLLSKKGLSKKRAILNACTIRLRPILMTTLAMVLGALPMIIIKGPGFEARFSFGMVIVPGMIFGTIFSLFILPVLYELFHFTHQSKEDGCYQLNK